MVISLEFYLILLFIFFSSLQLLFLIYTRCYIGDFFLDTVKVSSIEIIGLYFFYISTLIFFWIFYKKFLIKLKLRNKYIKYDCSTKKFIDKFYFGLLILNFFITFLFGIKANSKYTPHSLTFIINVYKIDILFSFYYFLNRSKNKLYIVNIVGTIFLELIQGWTGILFKAFIFELYFRLRGKVKIAKIISLTLLITTTSILAYSLLYPIREAIRHQNSDLKPLSLELSATFLLGRFSMFSNFVYIYQNSEILTKISTKQLPFSFEEVRFFRIITPSFIGQYIYPEYANYGIGNILCLYRYNFYLENSCGFAPSLAGVLLILYKRNFAELIFYLVFSLFILSILAFIINLFNNRRILYFPFFFYITYFAYESGEMFVPFANMLVTLFAFLLTILIYKKIKKFFN